MPTGKELEQLPMVNLAPGTGKDASKYERKVLGGIVLQTQPEPSEIEKENEDMV